MRREKVRPGGVRSEQSGDPGPLPHSETPEHLFRVTTRHNVAHACWPALLHPRTRSVWAFVLLWISAAFDQPVGAQLGSFVDDTPNQLVHLSVTLDDPDEKDFAAADLNRDGRADLVVVRKMPFSDPGPRPDVLLMNESGVLVDRTLEFGLTLETDARDVQVADFDGDGWTDFIVANTFGQRPTLYLNRGADSSGQWLGFVDASDRIGTITSNGDVLQFCAVATGDLDGDGDVDLIFANYRTQDQDSSLSVRDVVLVNDGNANFVDAGDTVLGTFGDHSELPFATGVELRDLDRDGDLDVIESIADGETHGQIRVLFLESSTVVKEQAVSVTDNDAYMFMVGDLDMDEAGFLDLYVVKDSQDQSLLTTNVVVNESITMSSGSLVSMQTDSLGGNVHMADVDGDGDLDVGVAPVDVDIPSTCGSASGFFDLLENDGVGNLASAPVDGLGGLKPHDFAFLDVNGDSCVDLTMGLCSGWRVFLQDTGACNQEGDGDGVFDLVDNCPLVANASQSDLDGDGTGDACDSDSFSFLIPVIQRILE